MTYYQHRPPRTAPDPATLVAVLRAEVRTLRARIAELEQIKKNNDAALRQEGGRS